MGGSGDIGDLKMKNKTKLSIVISIIFLMLILPVFAEEQTRDETQQTLEAPTLTAPEDYKYIPRNAFFSYTWDEVQGADSYVLQLSTDSFTNTVTDHERQTNSFYSSLQGSYTTESPYYWRVKSISGKVESPWSETRHITTIRTGEENQNNLEAPTLVSPEDYEYVSRDTFFNYR